MDTKSFSTAKESTWTKDFTYSFETNKPPEQLFDLLLDVRDWWSGLHGETITGKSRKIDDEFSFIAGGGAHFSKQKLVELVPHERIVWLVLESRLTFLTDINEWDNTRLRFNINRKGGISLVKFTHEGLSPKIECYNSCSSAWAGYMKNLERKLNVNY